MLIGAEVPFVSTDLQSKCSFYAVNWAKTLIYLSVALCFLEDLLMFLSVMSEHHVCAWCQGVLKRVSDHLDLELEMVMSHHVSPGN